MPPFLSQNLPWILLVVIVAALWLLKRPDVTPARAHELVAQGARLVDVRSPGEYAAGHIDGAINIPVDQIGNRASSLDPKDRPVVVYCASGTRSAMARRTLRSAGFTQVFNLGPMSRW